MTPRTEALDYAQSLAAACARQTMNTWHVLDDRGHYLIADDADAAAWGDRVVWTVEPEMAFSAAEMDDLPGIENEPSEPPVWPADNGRQAA